LAQVVPRLQLAMLKVIMVPTQYFHQLHLQAAEQVEDLTQLEPQVDQAVAVEQLLTEQHRQVEQLVHQVKATLAVMVHDKSQIMATLRAVAVVRAVQHLTQFSQEQLVAV
jgi:hypothetical protein